MTPAKESIDVEGSYAPGSRVAVLLPLPLAGPYDYRAEAVLRPGMVVRVPLGGRRLAGVVWGPGTGGVDESRLKPVGEALPVPPLPAPLRRFIAWVARYTLTPPGAVLRLCLSVPAALESPKPATVLMPVDPLPPALRQTPARQRVLAAATETPGAAADLARTAGVSAGVVRGLVQAGALAARPASRREAGPDPHHPGPTLSSDQAAAAAPLAAATTAGGFQVFLLDGVTGSGKTEVYFAAVAAALTAGRQALVLVPEIALTAQWLHRFEARFGAPPALWHSELGPARRRDTWRAVAEGRAPVVVGARSALFLPFPALGVLVVDEEHDPAFKQEDGVLYHARDMAVVRGREEEVPVVLVSATPALETVINADQGRYQRLHLPHRHGGAALPPVTLVDLRASPPQPPATGHRGWLAPPLVRALEATLAEGHQAMLFLNRRGYAPLTLCRACGHRLQCPHCSAWLVEHRRQPRLLCHHCGLTQPRPEVCPACGAADTLVGCGPGVERLAEEVALRFPQARLRQMTSDTVAGPAAAAELVTAVSDGAVDILVGTQMMAKGHHFPALTLVGVVDADAGLAGADPRAGERTFQMLTQVAGRAGRGAAPGRVLLQTWQPDSPLMTALAAGDRDGFLAAEAADRQAFGLPPFGRLLALVVSGADAAAVQEAATALARTAPAIPGGAVLGPAPAPLAVLRGRHRVRFLVRAPKDCNLQSIVRPWLMAQNPAHGVRIQVDVDPRSFL